MSLTGLRALQHPGRLSDCSLVRDGTEARPAALPLRSRPAVSHMADSQFPELQAGVPDLPTLASDPDLLPARLSALEPPPPALLKALLNAERNSDVHRALLNSLACMSAVEVSRLAPVRSKLRFPITCLAWNLERGVFPKRSTNLIREQGADVVLLSEVDNGMARTGQQHVAGIIAEPLDLGYVYGVEFLELGLGTQADQRLRTDDFNSKGFHGNAVLVPTPVLRAAMLRLEDRGQWFLPHHDQPRIGGRCAIVAEIPTEVGPMVCASVHLESHADGEQRCRQMVRLLDCLDRTTSGLPVLIGGDLNTGNGNGGDLSVESLFDVAAKRGYECHGAPLDQATKRSSLLSSAPAARLKLDWFLTRGLAIERSWIAQAVDRDKVPLSDHDMIACRIAGFA